jgi:hypothetical protein
MKVKSSSALRAPDDNSGSSSFGRASAFQAEGGRFEPGLPLKSVEARLACRNAGAARSSAQVKRFGRVKPM